MEKRERVRLMLDMIACNHPIYYWHYDTEGKILDSTCPAESLFDAVFQHQGGIRPLLQADADRPLVLSNEMNMMWLAVRESDNQTVHMLGPFFSVNATPTLLAHISRAIASSEGSARWRERLSQAMMQLPMVSSILYMQYVLMLHFCVLGEHAASSDVQYISYNLSADKESGPAKERAEPVRDRTVNYLIERAILDKIREGDLSALNQEVRYDRSSLVSIRSYTDNALLNLRIGVTSLIALCTRAAIEGGVSPTQAYITGDTHIAAVFQAHSTSEIVNIRKQMCIDFIQQVHKCRTNRRYSKAIQSCIDYIETHLREPLTIELLAGRLGYSKYYLSNRFKAETNCSINNYIKFCRIEQAKQILACSQKRIDEIASELGFGSRAFFDRAFKSSVGQTPADYRRRHLNL